MNKNNNSISVDGEKYSVQDIRFLIHENKTLKDEIKAVKEDLHILLGGI